MAIVNWVGTYIVGLSWFPFLGVKKINHMLAQPSYELIVCRPTSHKGGAAMVCSFRTEIVHHCMKTTTFKKITSFLHHITSLILCIPIYPRGGIPTKVDVVTKSHLATSGKSYIQGNGNHFLAFTTWGFDNPVYLTRFFREHCMG
jgi:hypothetical protein